MEDDGPPGVPEWVVTYGDMMSLLLTFFIMLVSLSEVVADKKYRAVLESLHHRFGYQTTVASAPGTNFPLNAMVERLTTLGSQSQDDDGHGGIKTRGAKGIDFHVFRNREGNGLPVGKPIPFSPGSSDVAADFGSQLDEIARRLAGMPNKVEVHGLAPSSANDSESRWLCFRRARLVRDGLVARRVAPERVRIVVDGQPRTVEATPGLVPADRVEVYVLDAHTSDFVGSEEG